MPGAMTDEHKGLVDTVRWLSGLKDTPSNLRQECNTAHEAQKRELSRVGIVSRMESGDFIQQAEVVGVCRAMLVFNIPQLNGLSESD